MSCTQDFSSKFIGVGSLLGKVFRTILNYKGDTYVHPYWSLGKANIDSSSYIAIYQNKKGSRGLDASGRETNIILTIFL